MSRINKYCVTFESACHDTIAITRGHELACGAASEATRELLTMLQPEYWTVYRLKEINLIPGEEA
jgi:hypothetical protein